MNQELSKFEPSASIDAAQVLNADGGGGVVFICEHASHMIPPEWQSLGLSEDIVKSHIGWDPGALGVASALCAAFDAPLIAGKISRLVYDCNRAPDADTAMPTRSETFDIPGNQNLDAAARKSRVNLIYKPFHTTVENVLAKHPDAPVVTIHSFTPVYFGSARAVEIGILHDEDTRLADAMLHQMARTPHRRVERNAPYGPQDGVTHMLERHGTRTGRANVMIEIRNDLISSSAQEIEMAKEIELLLTPALAAIGGA